MYSQKEIHPVYGDTNPSPQDTERMAVKRFGSVIGLRPDKEQYYRTLHAAVWPGIIERLKQSNVRNYSIYVAELEGRKYLFSYLEYTGNDYDADMRAISEDPLTREWWQETDPCQVVLPNRRPGAQWSDMERVFLMP